MMNKKTVSDFFEGSQRTRVALRQITCPDGFCLIVEDDPNIARYLQKILKTKKINSKVTDNSNDALYTIAEKSLSIICAIVDLNLEQKGLGRKIIDEFEYRHRNIPYVVYTGERDKETVLKKLYPHINVAIKGRNNTQILLNALGITNANSHSNA